MAGKPVLVTGGTGGIGQATPPGWPRWAPGPAPPAVIGPAPRLTRPAPAATGSHAVDAFAAGLSAQARVRHLAARVLATCPRLGVLANNARRVLGPRHVTAGGHGHTLALSHLAPFLLASLLLTRLTASAAARTVTVSSGARARSRHNFDELQAERTYSGRRACKRPELPNVLFARELARRLEGAGVTPPWRGPAWWPPGSAPKTRRRTRAS